MSDTTKYAKAASRRTNQVRLFPTNTCPASRHLHIMADCLMKAKKDGSLRYPMFAEEPEHCAASIYDTLTALWKARLTLKGIALPKAKVNRAKKKRSAKRASAK